MKLAIMLATSPIEGDVHIARELAMAAVRQGHEAFLFLTGPGVGCAAELEGTVGDGLSFVGCAQSARQLGLPQVTGVRWGNQMDWAFAAREADSVVILG